MICRTVKKDNKHTQRSLRNTKPCKCRVFLSHTQEKQTSSVYLRSAGVTVNCFMPLYIHSGLSLGFIETQDWLLLRWIPCLLSALNFYCQELLGDGSSEREKRWTAETIQRKRTRETAQSFLPDRNENKLGLNSNSYWYLFQFYWEQ